MANLRKNEPNRAFRFKHRAAGKKASTQRYAKPRGPNARKREIPPEPWTEPLRVPLGVLGIGKAHK